MIRLQRTVSVSDFLESMKQRYANVEKFRAYVKAHPREATARLDLEDFEFYSVHPEMQGEKIEHAISLIPVTTKALSMFTERRLGLLETLADRKFDSVRKLAGHLHRDVHNVYEDLRLFRKLGIVEFERGPRNSRMPRLLADSISLIPGRAVLSSVDA